MRCAKCLAAALIVFLVSLPPSAQTAKHEVLVYKKKFVMGTVFEIAAYDESSEQADAAIQKAFQEIVRIDDLLSDYKADSALSKLNRSAHLQTQTVPSDLYAVIEQAVKFSRLSGGKFDISVGPWAKLWKDALSGDANPSVEQQQRVKECIGYEKIEFNPPDQITFRSSCMQLDLGAIGKGYAVDKAADALQSAGVRSAFINAGGSTILAMGAPPNQTGWLVHLRDPSRRIDPEVILKDESVSTSEQSAPSLLGKESAGHIIDPDTGRPLRTDFAVSVIAKTGTVSDALSTSLLLLGPEKGKAMIRRMTDVSAVWISPKSEMEVATGGEQILFGEKK